MSSISKAELINPSDIPVVVLCGGQGTRIREASEKLPKPLVEIGSQPILWHIMKMYGSHGFRKFILCLGYKAWNIKEYFLRYEEMVSDVTVDLGTGKKTFDRGGMLDDWEVSLVDTGLHTGTGGRLQKVGHLIDSDYFMVTYGDGVGDLDLSAELTTLANSELTGLVTGVNPTSRYGELGVEGNVVTNFAEKLPSDGWVSGGFFAFKKDFLGYLPDDEPGHFFEQGPIHTLTHEKKLGMFPHSGFWMGMDTYREYTALNSMWEKDQAPWKMW